MPDLDVFSECCRLKDRSGWITRVAIQYAGDANQPTVYMEFYSAVECTDLNQFANLLESSKADERLIERGETLDEVWDFDNHEDRDWMREGEGNPGDYYYHGWRTEPGALERLRGIWSFAEEMLGKYGADYVPNLKPMAWILGHPDSPVAAQMMTEQIVRAQADLEKAEAAAADARSRLDIARAWFDSRSTPQRLHGEGCVDCDNGVTEFHRSRTNRPNPLAVPESTA